MSVLRIALPLAISSLLSFAASAQTVQRPAPAVSVPLTDVPVHVREQSLSTGKVTHATQVQTVPGQAEVTVRSIQPDSVIGNYRIDFAALDVDPASWVNQWDLNHAWGPEGETFRKDPRFAELARRIGIVEYWKQYGFPDGCSAGPDTPIVCS